MAKTSSGGRIGYNKGVFTLSYNGVEYLKSDRVMFAPTLAKQNLPEPAKTTFRNNTLTYRFDRGPIATLKVTFEVRKGRFEVASEAVAARNVTLSAWNVFGPGRTFAGFDQIVVANPNIKGRLTTGVFDKMRLDDQFRSVTHTMGLGLPSWFFPLPTHYMLACYRHMLFLGLDEVGDFSEWTIGYEGKNITQWSLDYGEHLSFKKGQTLRSPRWIGFFVDTDNPFDPWPIYTAMLRKRSRITNPHDDRPAWWADLNYVTWGDQHVMPDASPTRTYNQTETNLSEDTVRRWVGIIEKYKLPFRTITIDGYWCPRIGQWHADQKRFPDMRGLVDELHERGYKVIFWYCPFEADRAAPVFKEHPEFFVEETVRQQLFLEKDIAVDVRPRYDYTHPGLRDFVRQDIRRMLSPEPGCYNGDGMKLDFYGSAPNAKRTKTFHDPSWGLGHRFILNAHASIYRWAKEFKPDCRVDGENGNPFFADYTDSLRAWDWCHPDYTVYNDRVKLASVICPGVPALYDEHIYFANLYKYCLRSAAARPIFFNVDVFHGDMVKPTPKQYRMLAEVLAVVADLNRRARDVTPQSLDEGRIYDWSDKLIGKVAADDTTLVAERNGAFTAVLLNDTDQPRTKGVTIDPSEFAARGKPFTLTAKLAPQTLRVLTGP